MQHALIWLAGVLLFLTVIAISIALHEAGHMVVAKKLKIPVPRFFVGFGPTIWSKKIGETEYGVKAIPLGGFIQVQDVTQPEGSPERELLSYVAPWKRLLIFVAGPVVNLILGTTILFLLLTNTPFYEANTTVATVDRCGGEVKVCAAYQAGLRPGDRIVELDGKPVKGYGDIRQNFAVEGSHLVVERQGKLVPLTVKADATTHKVGLTVGTTERRLTAGEAASSIGNIFERSVHSLASIPAQVPGVAKAIIGEEKRNPEGVSSVVGVGRAYGDVSVTNTMTQDEKVKNLIAYSGLLNLGLGVANLLPMLPLDGGRMFVALIDALKMGWARLLRRAYEPLDFKWVGAMTAVTGLIVFAYMALMIVADIVVPIKVV